MHLRGITERFVERSALAKAYFRIFLETPNKFYEMTTGVFFRVNRRTGLVERASRDARHASPRMLIEHITQ